MKTALLTGGSSDIGRAIAKELGGNGWQVIAPDRRELDLSDPHAAAAYGAKLAKQFDTLDAFIHVAGLWHDETGVLANKHLPQFTSEQIVKTMNVGLTSAVTLCAALLPIMDHKTVIGISGTFADGAAGWLPYYTSKRGLEDFLVGLAQDAPGINAFGISPSDTATRAYKQHYPQYFDEAQPPEVVAKLVADLLSGPTSFKSSDIIELKHGKSTVKFHA